MFRLYYATGTCALATHIALEEAGAPYEAIAVDFASQAQRSPEYLADPPQFSLLSVEPVLGINKDLLRTHVEHQPAVVNLRAVILFMRRIWTGNNAGRIMRVASAEWISSCF